MSDFTYDKSRKRWLRADGSQVQLGNRILNKKGDYIQLNSDGTTTTIGTKGKGLNSSYVSWAKQHKINTALDDQAMKAGLIKENNQWRPNNTNKTRTITKNGRTYFLGTDGSWRNIFNGLEYNQDIKSLKASNKDTANQGPESYAGKTAQWISDIFGHKLNNKASELAGTAIYMVPFLGEGISALDAIDNFRKGNIKEGLINTLFAIPGVGRIGRGVKAAAALKGAFNTAKTIKKGLNYWKPIEKGAGGLTKMYMAYSLPEAGANMYKAYKGAKQAKEEYSDITNAYKDLSKQGYSDQQIQQIFSNYGEQNISNQDFNTIKTLANSNSVGDLLWKGLTEDNFM